VENNTIRNCSEYAAHSRAGVPETGIDEDAFIFVDESFLVEPDDQLAICCQWIAICIGITAVDVYCESVPFQQCISDD
jgi:hypothetical protein